MHPAASGASHAHAPVASVAKRRYDDGCATAHALNVVGERWALLVVRELLLGPRRFTDLRAALPGIGPNVLAQRLSGLTEAGVVARCLLAPPASVWAYELTPWGRELEAPIAALGRWGARSPALPRGRPMSAASLVLSMRTMFDPSTAAGVRLSLDLAIGAERFAVTVGKGSIAIEPGAASDPDARIASDVDTLARLAYDGAKLGDSIESGAVVVDGDRSAAKRFFKLFTLPEPAKR